MATSRSINAPVVPGALFFFRDEEREAARPGSLVARPGSLAARPGSLAARPGSLAARPW